MKQTQNTQACSLVREEAVAYSLVRGKAAALTRENGERRHPLWYERESDGNHYTRAGSESSKTIAKQK